MSEKKSVQKRFKQKIALSAIAIGVIAGSVFLFAVLKTASAASQETVMTAAEAGVIRWAFLSASISVGLSALAAGFAVSYVGAAAMGAISEKPELVGRSLIFVGLAEGIAIYGLIIAIMILTRA